MASTINASNSGAGGLISTGDASGQLQLQTAGTTAVTIDTSQNVGIGTTSPTEKLDVQSSADLKARIYTTGTTLSTHAGLTLKTGSYEYLIQNLTTTASSAGALRFYDITAGAERMRIDSSGKVLVGTTNADNPTDGIVLYSATQNSQLVIGHGSGTPSGYNFAKFDYNASAIGSITQNGTTAVAYNTSSDYRLKENIAPLTGALNKVAQLKPVTYTWKASPEETGEGFIAHELAEVCPQAVHGTKDAVDADGNPVYQGIDTSFLVATLTAAIQEQQALIVDLQARLAKAGL